LKKRVVKTEMKLNEEVSQRDKKIEELEEENKESKLEMM
jgi:hypothetical protein